MDPLCPTIKYEALKPEEKAAIDHKLKKMLDSLENEEGYSIKNAEKWLAKAKELFAGESKEFIKELQEEYRNDMAKKSAKGNRIPGIGKGEEFQGIPSAPPAFESAPRGKLGK